MDNLITHEITVVRFYAKIGLRSLTGFLISLKIMQSKDFHICM